MKKIFVLNSQVPAGGRNITSSECALLRSEGISCSARYVVMPYAPNINHGGPLYRPGEFGGLDNTGHVLGVK